MTLNVSGGLIVALGGIGPALAIGMIGAKAVVAIARNPEVADRIMVAMMMGMAFAEAIAIYAVLVAFLRGL